MARTLKIVTLLALVFCVGTVMVAQTALEIVHKSGTVLGKYEGKVVVKMDDGSVRAFTPAPGKTIMVDGVQTTYEMLKVGTVLAADFVKTTTTVPVQTTEIKNGTVVRVVGRTMIYKDAKGYKSVDLPPGFTFLLDGEEMTLAGLRPNMKLTAMIVHTSSKEVTEAEVRNLGGVAPAAPAPMVAPAPEPAPEPPPAPEPRLPKTGSPLPLAAFGGALSLLAGLGVRSFRRSR